MYRVDALGSVVQEDVCWRFTRRLHGCLRFERFGYDDLSDDCDDDDDGDDDDDDDYDDGFGVVHDDHHD